MAFPVNSMTAGIFYPRIDVASGVEFAREFIRRTGTALDHDPIILPFHDPLPPEAPRIVLRSKSLAFVCEFAQTRVNLHYHCRGQLPEYYDMLFPRYRETLYHVITALAEMVAGKPDRLGFVVRFLKQTNADSSTALLEEFLADDRFNEAAETHLHFLHLIDLEGMPCNRWTRFRTIRPASARRSANAALFEVDVNSRVEYQHLFEPHEVISFYLEAYEEIRKQADRLLTFASDI